MCQGPQRGIYSSPGKATCLHVILPVLKLQAKEEEGTQRHTFQTQDKKEDWKNRVSQGSRGLLCGNVRLETGQYVVILGLGPTLVMSEVVAIHKSEAEKQTI